LLHRVLLLVLLELAPDRIRVARQRDARRESLGALLLVLLRTVERVAGLAAEARPVRDGQLLEIARIPHDVRRQDHDQVHLARGVRGPLEGPAQNRDVSEPGDLVHDLTLSLLDDAADHHRLAVLNVDRVLHGPLREGDAEVRAGRRGDDLADLLEDVQANRVALADLGRHA
jgi:hypothetical protein